MSYDKIKRLLSDAVREQDLAKADALVAWREAKLRYRW